MLKWCFFLSIVFISCNGIKNASTFSVVEKQITFEKSKIKITSKDLGNITLNGYISLYRDSLICFKFYGPFSVDVLSGVYKESFQVYDNFNKVRYPNFDSTFFSKSGFKINRNVLEFLFLGRVSELQGEFSNLNQKILRIESFISSKRSELMIFNDSEQKLLKITIILKNQIPKSILLNYKDPLNYWNANIQNVFMTNRPKKCNFGF